MLKIRSYVFRWVNDVSNNVCRHRHTNNSLEQKSQHNFIAWSVNENFVKRSWKKILKMSSPHIPEFNLKFPVRIPEKWIGRSEKNSFEVLWVTVVVDEVDKSKFFILSFNSYSNVVKIVTVLIFCHVCVVMRTLLWFRESEQIYYVNVSIINKWNLINFRQLSQSQKRCIFFRSTQWARLDQCHSKS